MKTIQEFLDSDMTFTPAVIGYLLKDDTVLLGLRKKVETGMGLNLIAGIGGKLRDAEEIKNETDDEGMIREFKEEISVTPTKFTKLGRVRFIWPDKLKWSQDVRIYTVQEWSGEPNETESMKPEWFPIKDLPLANMWEDNAFWIPPSLEGEKVDMVFLIGNDNKILDQISL